MNTKLINQTKIIFCFIAVFLLIVLGIDCVKSIAGTDSKNDNTTVEEPIVNNSNSKTLVTYDTEVIVDAETKVEYILFKNEDGNIISLTPRYNNKGEIMTSNDTASVSFYYKPIME